LFVLQRGDDTNRFVEALKLQFENLPNATLLSERVKGSLGDSLQSLRQAGAEVLAGGETANGPGCSFENTLSRVSASQFLQSPEVFQSEAFGPASLIVVCEAIEVLDVANKIEGSLTATIYGDDRELLVELTKVLRKKAGRILHNKMPTGVAVSPAMNHGGPFPASGHPRFSAVGMPASIERFTKLDCYDNVADEFLPGCLQNSSEGS
jgi:NADP-dependent aldehyde dehydrogenase